jgi:glycosyltransferase involved in cell wall biosynthesis
MSKQTPNDRVLYLVMDGDFARKRGVASSNRNHFAIFGRRYTEVFEQVYIMCRVHDVEDERTLPVGGQGVDVIALPPVHGWRDLMRHGPDIVKAFCNIPRDAVVLLRVPGIYPILAWLMLAMRRQPYGVEAMADADAQFTPGAYQKRFRGFYRMVWTRMMKLQCRHAAASSYVTTNALQSQFPPRAGRPSFSYTTLDLPEQSLVRCSRPPASFQKPEIILINVAMMQKHLKGQDLIIRAVARLAQSGVRLKLWLVGDGDTRGEFERLAAELGVSDNVKFLGRVQAGAEVFALLDQADIFVLPSRQEGLPRVVIEAMARSLPCFASALPGNRELLDREFLVALDDEADWVLKLHDAIGKPEFLARASQANLAAARRFTVGRIQPIRNRFYETLSSFSLR